MMVAVWGPRGRGRLMPYWPITGVCPHGQHELSMAHLPGSPEFMWRTRLPRYGSLVRPKGVAHTVMNITLLPCALRT